MRKSCVFFVLAIMLLSACGDKNIRPHAELKPASNEGLEYVAKSGDVLLIRVWGEPRLSGEAIVRDDGKFSIPLVDDIQAEGLTIKEITEGATAKLKEFIPTASVNISVIQTAPIRYYLSGSFQKPGEYRSDKQISLLQAIATGGGFIPFADESNVILIRQSPEGELRYRFDYNRVVDGAEPNPELRNGDIVSIR